MKRLFALSMLILVLLPFSAARDGHAQSREPSRTLEPPPPTEEFVPLNELPPEERLPAARLLIAAYVVVWFGLFAYVWTVWRRLRKIEGELGQIETRLSGRRGKQ